MSDLRIAFSFARREMRVGLSGFRIFIACLTLGVAVIAAVGSVNRAIVDGVNREGAAILGSDMRLGLFQARAPESLEQWAAERRATISRSSRLRTMARTADGQMGGLVELRAIDSAYPLYGTVRTSPVLGLHENLQKNPTTGRYGVFVDPAIIARFGIAVGDILKLGSILVEIKGTLENVPDQTGLGFQLGPTVMASEEALAATGLVTVGSLINHYYGLRFADPALDLTALREELKADFPDQNWQVRDRRNAAPGLTRTINRVGEFLVIVGLAALVVGGVGVGNAVKGYMDRKTKTIATLKILGASGRIIGLTYFLQILIIALACVAIGLGFGALAPDLVSGFLPDAIPFEITGGFYPDVLALSAAYGLLITIAFTAWPLGRAQRLPAVQLFRDVVGAAPIRPSAFYVVLIILALIATVILAISLASSPIFAASFMAGALLIMGCLRGLSSLIMRGAKRLPHPRHVVGRLALANLHRPGAVTGAVVLSLGLGLTLFATLALVRDNLAIQLREGLPDRAPSHFMVDIQPYEVAGLETDLLSIEGMSDFQTVPSLRGTVVKLNGRLVDEELEKEIPQEYRWVVRGDRGMSYGQRFRDSDTLLEGSWWPDDYAGPPEVSVVNDEAQALGLKLGDTVTVNILGLEITATVRSFRDVDFSDGGINYIFVFDPHTLKAAPHTYLATIKAPPAQEAAVLRLMAQNYQGVTVISINDAIKRVKDVIDQISAAIDVTALVAIIAGVLVLAGAIAVGYRQRVYESVVLKLVGAVRGKILSAYALEFAAVGLATGLVALGFSALAAWAIVTFTWEGSFVLVPGPVIVILGVSLSVTLMIGLGASWSALRVKPNQILRSE